MEERVGKGQASETPGGSPEEDILDIADLLEDVPEPGGEEPPPVDLDAVFAGLDDVSADDEEDIIDLVDRADEDPSPAGLSGPEPAEGLAAAAGLLDDFSFDDLDLGDDTAGQPPADIDLEEEFIGTLELEDILKGPGGPQAGAGLTGDLAETGETAGGALTGGPGPEPRGDADRAAAAAGQEPSIDDARIDAALERVIRRLYAEKIDAILVEAVERTVNQEISRLKAIINQGSSDR